MILLGAGIILSLSGSLPPGLISLAVAQTSIYRGFGPAILLAIGAAVAEFFQACAALAFAAWFLANPMVAKGFQIVAIPVFGGLAVYLWFFAKAPKAPEVELAVVPWRQFVQGVVISTFNLLAIPYWVAYAGWLRLNGWWQGGAWHTFLFASGVTIGTMVALTLYAWLARELTKRSELVARIANRFVALIFLSLAIKIAYDLFR